MGAGGSVHAVRMRITRLGADGAPVVGANNMYVTSALTTLGFTEQYTDDEEIELKNGAGELCVYYKAPGSLKSLEVKLTICTMDPELAEILRGGTVLTAASTAVGYAAPSVGTQTQPNGISVEAWSRRIINGAMDNTRPYYHWVLPRVRFKRDEQTLGNEAAQPAFTGVAEENDGWDDGPMNDWAFTSDRLYQYAEVAAADLPAAAQGYLTVPTP